MISKARTYFTETFRELKKIETPTRSDTIQTTIRTVIILIIFSVVLSGMDWLFRNLMWQIF